MYDDIEKIDNICGVNSNCNRSAEDSSSLAAEEEAGEDGESEVSVGLDNDNGTISIDYQKLTASIREASNENYLDSDLNTLQVTDICLLLVLLILGIILLVRC